MTLLFRAAASWANAREIPSVASVKRNILIRQSKKSTQINVATLSYGLVAPYFHSCTYSTLCIFTCILISTMVAMVCALDLCSIVAMGDSLS